MWTKVVLLLFFPWKYKKEKYLQPPMFLFITLELLKQMSYISLFCTSYLLQCIRSMLFYWYKIEKDFQLWKYLWWYMVNSVSIGPSELPPVFIGLLKAIKHTWWCCLYSWPIENHTIQKINPLMETKSKAN